MVIPGVVFLTIRPLHQFIFEDTIVKWYLEKSYTNEIKLVASYIQQA